MFNPNKYFELIEALIPVITPLNYVLEFVPASDDRWFTSEEEFFAVYQVLLSRTLPYEGRVWLCEDKTTQQHRLFHVDEYYRGFYSAAGKRLNFHMFESVTVKEANFN